MENREILNELIAALNCAKKEREILEDAIQRAYNLDYLIVQLNVAVVAMRTIMEEK